MNHNEENPMRSTFLGACLIATLSGPPLLAQPASLKAQLHDAAGAVRGTVVLKEHEGMVHALLKANGLTPGPHGLHIHAVGQCTGDSFSGAGPHWNPDGKQHGLSNSMGAHKGDLPQIIADKRGKGMVRFMIMAPLSDVIDGDGAAFIIHANPDDGKTDPSGNSGPRLLCGAFGRS
jgi:superoxide dismutase, Cu-Zn family